MRTITRSLQAVVAIALSAVVMTGCTTGEAESIGTAETTSSGRQVPDSDRASDDGEGHYAAVNGLELYYEIHGTGRPLVLIHGGLDTIDSAFGTLLPDLAKTRQVIAVELQAHGHTADIDRPLRYELMADDIVGLVTHLGLEKVDVLGYSLGGGVAQQLGSRNPDLVNKLVVISAPYKSDGWYPEVRAGMAAMNPDAMTATPMHEIYAQTAPKPSEWPVLVTKTRELLAENYDWTAAIASITAPTLVVIADFDSVRLTHAVELFGLLGEGKADGAMGGAPSSRLAVVPGSLHYNILSRTDLLLPIISPFLDEPNPK
ncbi:alpha/beta fold hydrolase [Rhodococcus sp. OK302]|uniref:alpha/beta fold hydrolase n=1 Tax=Rhodococcus sp. OK302 TaxID=1882769 RepID=UPI000B9F504A|nr:alpha/beta hydrolase [Rhodococcus sp. OK302]OYD61014.1 pimeloyl-ACP methyl ester carboxylesterase [Rhodococcus sp. OK302]